MDNKYSRGGPASAARVLGDKYMNNSNSNSNSSNSSNSSSSSSSRNSTTITNYSTVSGAVNSLQTPSVYTFMDDPEIKRMGKRLQYGSFTSKPIGRKTAFDNFLAHFNIDLNRFEVNLGNLHMDKICKRLPKEEGIPVYNLGYGYRLNSFKKASIILIGVDNDSNTLDSIRSYATMSIKYVDGKAYLYVDAICSCDKNFCPINDGSRGPGGANLLTLILHDIVRIKNENRLEGIILNAVPGDAEEAYRRMNFKPYNRDLQPPFKTMVYKLSSDNYKNIKNTIKRSNRTASGKRTINNNNLNLLRGKKRKIGGGSKRNKKKKTKKNKKQKKAKSKKH